MLVKSFGCSFIFGSDLADGKNLLVPAPSGNTWPSHLALYLKRTYYCYARPGIGNLQILEQILSQSITADQQDLFVIGWTWIDRFDCGYNIKNPGLPWLTIRPGVKNDSSKIYYKDFHSEYQDKLTSLIYIKLAIDTLQQKNIKFIMTYMDDLLFDQTWNSSSAVESLQSYVRPHMYTFDGMNFLDWSRKKGYPESKEWHPLEQAHAAAAELVIKTFDKQNTIDPVQQVRV